MDKLYLFPTNLKRKILVPLNHNPPFHDITGRTMANPASTPTDAVGSSPADSESREAATRPQNAPLATTATAGHHGPRTSPDGGGGMGEDGVESDQRLSVS